MQTYTIPFDLEDIPDLDYNVFMTLVEKHGLSTTFYFNTEDNEFKGTRDLGGTAENLEAFYRELDGSAQSFNTREFNNFISNYQDEDADYAKEQYHHEEDLSRQGFTNPSYPKSPTS